MIDLSEFESISPYTDEEAAEALSKLAEFPLLSQISQQFFQRSLKILRFFLIRSHPDGILSAIYFVHKERRRNRSI